MIAFVFEAESGFQIEQAAFRAAIQEKAWRDGDSSCQEVSSSNKDAIRNVVAHFGIDHAIPVGSVEFLYRYCQEYGVQEPVAMNVPMEIQNVPGAVNRAIWRNVAMQDLDRLLQPGKPYLVKPGRHYKAFETQLYIPGKTKLVDISDSEPLFVQEYLSDHFLSEWRLFMTYGEIIDQRPYYMGNNNGTWTVPDKDRCELFATALSAYPALAVDVAVVGSAACQRTIFLEAHPFLSCGLYGWEGIDILRLSRLAWKAQCSAAPEPVQQPIQQYGNEADGTENNIIQFPGTKVVAI